MNEPIFVQRCGAVLTVCGALMSMPVFAQTDTTVVGKLPGEFGVSPSGAATYRVPLEVPPGVAGMQPKLALAYSSQSGASLMGLGWSLEGLSTITRCPVTRATDGVSGSIKFNAGDRFCLDGARLINVSGSYGAANSEYRTEIDSFSQMHALGAAGGNAINGPASFVVRTKAGVVMEYGATNDARVEVPGKSVVYYWALNRLTDAKGNAVSFTYLKNATTGVHRIQSIDYAGGSLSFQFLDRPDKRFAYVHGGRVAVNERLSKIDVMRAGVLLHSYQLTYSQESSTGRSRLSSLKLCYPLAVCREPLDVSYAVGGEPGFEALQQWSTYYSQTWEHPSHYSTIEYLDLNGDGLPDVCGRASDGIYCALNLGNGTGFSSVTKWSSGYGATWETDPSHYGTIRFPDLNGDGLPDICGRAANGVMCGLNTGAGFAPVIYWTYAYGASWEDPSHYSTIQYVDLNGDGLADICGRGGDGMHCALNVGTGFGTASRWTAAYGATWETHPSHYGTIRFPDLNGDGLPDICGRAANGVMCGLNTGAGFDPVIYWTYAYGASWEDPSHYTTIQYVDLNGDGLADICGRGGDGMHCALNVGTGFGTASRWTAAYGVEWASHASHYGTISFADLNGDGLPDICGRSGSGLMCGLNTGGTSFGTVSHWTSSYGPTWEHPSHYSTIQYVDLNGDGLADVCGRASSGLFCHLSKRTSARVAVAFSNGSRVLQVAYSELKDGSYLAGTSSTYPDTQIRSASGLVSRTEVSNGAGGLNRTVYRYGALEAEHASTQHPGSGRGVEGFKWMSVLEEATGIESYTEYSQSWPTIGQVTKSETRLAGAGNAGLLKRSTNSYGCHQSHAASGTTMPGSPTVGCSGWAVGKVYAPFVATTIEESWDLNGAAMPVITTTNTYSGYAEQGGSSRQFGDPTQIQWDIHEGAALKHRKLTVNEYHPAKVTGGQWQLGRLKKATVTSTEY